MHRDWSQWIHYNGYFLWPSNCKCLKTKSHHNWCLLVMTGSKCWCDSNEWSESHSVVSDSLWTHGLYRPWNSPGQNTEVGSCSLLQGILPTQGSSPGLPHCRQILYQLSHKASPRILQWVAYPFTSKSFPPRIQTWVSCIVGGFFTNWAIIHRVSIILNFLSSICFHHPTAAGRVLNTQ